MNEEELKRINYIFNKNSKNKEFTKEELEAITKINVQNKKLLNLYKVIWENRNNKSLIEEISNTIKGVVKDVY